MGKDTNVILLSVQGVIGFDFDQTLVDSKTGILRTIETILYENRIDFTFVDLNSRLNQPLQLIFEPWKDKLNLETANERYMNLYPIIARKHTSLLPGSEQCIQYLKHFGYSIIIVSAKQQKTLEHLVLDLNIDADKLFGNSYKEQKTKILRENNAVCYIGDHPNDVVSAKNVPCKSVVTLTGLNKIEDFINLKPDLIIENLTQHKKILEVIV